MAEEIEVVWEPCLGGYLAYVGTLKIAVLGTNQDQGLVRNGATIYEAMAAEHWGLHFTAPSLSVALLRALLDSLPTEPCPLSVPKAEAAPVPKAARKTTAEKWDV